MDGPRRLLLVRCLLVLQCAAGQQFVGRQDGGDLASVAVGPDGNLFDGPGSRDLWSDWSAWPDEPGGRAPAVIEEEELDEVDADPKAPRKYCARGLVKKEGKGVGHLRGDAKTCATKCSQTKGCQSFAYKAKARHCWLKDKKVTASSKGATRKGSEDYKTYYVCTGKSLEAAKKNATAAKKNATAAKKNATAAAPRKYCQRSLVKKEGKNVGAKKGLRGDAKACAKECTGTKGCKSFAYAPKKRRCYLKDKDVTTSQKASTGAHAKDYKTYYICTAPGIPKTTKSSAANKTTAAADAAKSAAKPTKAKAPPVAAAPAAVAKAAKKPPAAAVPTPAPDINGYCKRNLAKKEGKTVFSMRGEPKDCAKKCDAMKKCKSFAHKAKAHHCWLKDKVITPMDKDAQRKGAKAYKTYYLCKGSTAPEKAATATTAAKAPAAAKVKAKVEDAKAKVAAAEAKAADAKAKAAVAKVKAVAPTTAKAPAATKAKAAEAAAKAANAKAKATVAKVKAAAAKAKAAGAKAAAKAKAPAAAKAKAAAKKPIVGKAPAAKAKTGKAGKKGKKAKKGKKPVAQRKYCERTLVRHYGKTVRKMSGAVTDCAGKCDTIKNCRSFTYKIKSKTCWLKDKAVTSADEISKSKNKDKFKTYYVCGIATNSSSPAPSKAPGPAPAFPPCRNKDWLAKDA